MKKHIFFLCLGLALVLSCKKQEIRQAQPSVQVSVESFTATLPSGSALNFSEGELIQAFRYDGSQVYPYKATSSGKSSAFSYAGEGKAPLAVGYAVYPVMELDSLFRGQFYAKLPSAQKAVEGGADPATEMNIGMIQDGTVELGTVPAYVEFSVDQIGVQNCTVVSKDMGLSGSLRATTGDSVSVYSLPGSSKRVELAGPLESGRTYRIAIIPGQHKAFEFIYSNSAKAVTFDNLLEGNFAVAPGGILKLGKIGNPNSSVVSFTMSSTEFAGYELLSVVAYSDASRKKVFGNSDCRLVLGPTPGKISCYGIDPCDYSAEDFWYVLTLEKGDDSIVLPIKKKGPNIQPASECVVDLGVISEGQEGVPAWYYPHADKRLMCGAGYAYGDANTYFIQYKGSTYSGSADPDPAIPSEVTIDYRARGDFMSVPRPENVSFEFYQGYGGKSNNTWGVHTGDRYIFTNGDQYSITVDKEHYKVTVRNTGAHAQAPVLVMKNSEGKIMWAWAFWNVAADGTRIREVDFGGTKVCNLDIGQASDQIEKFAAKTQLRRTTYYYQWGRPMPVFWQVNTNGYFGKDDPRNIGNINMPICDSGAISVEQALGHPCEIITNPVSGAKGSKSEVLYDWCLGGVSAGNKDLWGGSATSPAKEAGTKSIYDPCPKGWRVMDAATVNGAFPAPIVGYDTAAYPQSHTSNYQGVYASESALFTCSGYLEGNVTCSAASGTPSVNQTGMGSATSGTTVNSACCWTNAFYSGENSYVFRYDYEYTTYAKTAVNPNRTIGLGNKSISNALPVRCQIDTEKR